MGAVHFYSPFFLAQKYCFCKAKESQRGRNQACLKYTKITKYFVQKHKMESLVKKLQTYRKML